MFPLARPLLLPLAALALQALAALFFIGDALHELATDPDTRHPVTELPVSVALCVGIAFTLRELLRGRRHSDEQARALALASMAFVEVIESRFRDWRLTVAERDVAWMALKGVEVTEIARLRGAAQGTVRAQMARIYGKSGVTGRAQFASLFVDQLMGHLPLRPGGPSPGDGAGDAA